MKRHCYLVVFAIGILVHHQVIGQSEFNSAKTFTGNSYAIIYGISDYTSSFPKLNYPDDDAKAFYDLLVDTRMVQPSNVWHNFDSASSGNDFLNAILKSRAKLQEGDRLFIYFAGHGDVEAEGIEEGYLIFSKCTGVPYASNANTVELSTLEKYIKAIVEGNKATVILITDACRPGVSAGSDKPSIPFEFFDERIPGAIMFFSCSPGEFSQEMTFPNVGGHGLFTYYLLEALAGLCVDEGKDAITPYEVQEYVERNVKKLSNNQQNPFLKAIGLEKKIFLPVDTTIRTAYLLRQNSKIEDLAKIESRRINRSTIKGDSELKKQDSIIYAKFQNQLREGKYLDPKNNNALQTIKDAEKTKIGKETIYFMKLDLSAKLEDVIQPTLSGFLRGEFQDIPDSLFRDAANKMGVVMDLTDSADFRYDEIRAKRSFFLAVIYQKTDPKRTLQLLQYADKLMPNASYINFEIGRQYAAALEFDSALLYLNKAIRLSPRWSYPRLEIGNIHFSKKEYERAQDMYKKAIELQPNFSLALFNNALIYKILKQKDSADHYYKKATAINPGFAKLWLTDRNVQTQAVAMGKNIQPQRVDEVAFAALLPPKPENNPALPQASLAYDYYNKAYDFSLVNKSDSASYWYRQSSKLFEQAYQQKKLTVDYYYTWGQVYQNLLQYDKAIEVYKLAYAQDSIYHSTYAFAIAWCNSAMKNFDEAVKWYETSIRHEPSYVDAYNNLGYTYYQMKDYKNSLLYYHKAVQLNPKYSRGLMNLGDVYFEMARDDSSIYFHKLSLKYGAPDVVTINRIGLSYKYLAQYDSAATYFIKAIKLSPTEPVYYFNLGDVYFNQADYHGAIVNYEKGNEYSADDSKVYIDLALAHAYSKNHKKAIELLKSGLQKDKNKKHLYLYHYNLGWVLDQTNNTRESLNWYKLAIKSNPQYVNAYNNIGYGYSRLGKNDSAIYWYRLATQVDPEYTRSMNNLAILFNDLGKYDSALHYYKKYVLLVNNDDKAYYELAQLYYYEGKVDSAADYYYKAIDLNRSNPNYYAKYGDALFDLGYYDNAAVSYGYALQLDSTLYFSMNRMAVAYIYTKKFKEGKEILELALSKDKVYKDIYEYNLACIHSLEKNIPRALYYYEESLKSGYKDLAHMSQDTDLDNIRTNPEFRKIVEKYFTATEIAKHPTLFGK